MGDAFDGPPRAASGLILGDGGRIVVRHRSTWEVREVVLEAGVVLPRHAHTDLTLVVQLEGAYTQRMRDGEIQVSSGEAVALPPGEPHEERVEQRSRALLIRPTDRLSPEDTRALRRRWTRSEASRIRRLVRTLERELATSDDLSPDVVDGLSFALFDQLSGCDDDVAGAPPDWLLRVREELDDRFREEVELDWLASRTGVSRGHLTRAFRGSFGRSIGEYLRWRRLEAAARSLRETNAPLLEVALSSGFYDQSHMTRMFRRYLGVTPLGYRQARDSG